MAKITLGKRPANFKHTVTFRMLDGDEGQIGMVYKYRTKREFAALIDETFPPPPPPAPPAEDGAEPAVETAKVVTVSTVAETIDLGLKDNAEYILKIADGWDLPDPFDQEHIEQLGDEQPAAVLAIMSDYRVAITQGRLGN